MLFRSQPTLSRQMAAFEEELGVTLFIRSGKKISLTDEGILLKRRALEIDVYKRQFLGGVLSGVVEPIGAVMTILVAQLVIPALPYLLSFAAVSYTHLDVYKRQL